MAHGRSFMSESRLRLTRGEMAGLVLLLAVGCAEPTMTRPALPSVAPATQPSGAFQIAGGEIRPMYREMLAVDLETVARVAATRNIDIRQARQRVEASRGQNESSVEAMFPVIAPA